MPKICSEINSLQFSAKWLGKITAHTESGAQGDVPQLPSAVNVA
jgi:hypothetical protein